MREDAVIDDLCRILRAGVNVVSTSYATLVEPSLLPDVAATLNAAAREGGASVRFAGIHPGFALDLLPAVSASLCTSIRAVTPYEIWNVSAYVDPIICTPTSRSGPATRTNPAVALHRNRIHGVPRHPPVQRRSPRQWCGGSSTTATHILRTDASSRRAEFSITTVESEAPQRSLVR